MYLYFILTELESKNNVISCYVSKGLAPGKTGTNISRIFKDCFLNKSYINANLLFGFNRTGLVINLLNITRVLTYKFNNIIRAKRFS